MKRVRLKLLLEKVYSISVISMEQLMAGNKSGRNKFNDVIKIENMNIQNGEVKLKFNFNLPEGYHINPDALPQISISSENNITQPYETELNVTSGMFEVPLKVNNG